jgi:hypothetical protein
MLAHANIYAILRDIDKVVEGRVRDHDWEGDGSSTESGGTIVAQHAAFRS